MTLVSLTQEFWIGSWWRPVSYARLMHCGCVASANGLAALSSLNSVILQEMHDNQVNDLRSIYQFVTREIIYWLLRILVDHISYYNSDLPFVMCFVWSLYAWIGNGAYESSKRGVLVCLTTSFSAASPRSRGSEEHEVHFVVYYFISWYIFPIFFVYTVF